MPEAVSGLGMPPQAGQKGGDRGVLFRFGPRCQRRAGHTALEQQGDGVVVFLAGVQLHGALALPPLETVGLVVRLRVAPHHLEHDRTESCAAGGGDPRGAAAGLIRLADLEGPSLAQSRHRSRQRLEPVAPALGGRRVVQVPRQRQGPARARSFGRHRFMLAPALSGLVR